MNFDSFFERKNRAYKKNIVSNEYRDEGNRQQVYNRSEGSFNAMAFISSLKNSRKLKIAVAVILFVVIAIIVGLIAIFFPLLTSIIDYVSQNGVAGIFTEVIDLLNKLWNGAK